MAGVLLKYILILLINQHFDVEGIYQGWQLCSEKCYHLGLANVTFIVQSSYCNSLSSNAQPVRYGQALSTKLSTCTLHKLDEEPYWIRRHDSQNHKTLTCHTLSFSGNNVHMDQNVSCSTFSHPFCETDKSFCQTSTNSNTDITVTNGLESSVPTCNASLVPATAGSSDWQPCLDKCYYMGSKMDITFADQASYCHANGGSKPVDFASKLEQTVAIELATCRPVKVDNEPYWMNKITVSNIGTSTCRTITFSGSNIHIDQNVPCSSLSHPFCEAEKSNCQTSASNTTLTSHWVSVAGQRSFYKLSSSSYTYCEAKDYCEGTELGQIAPAGNYSFMGLLGLRLGITGQMKVDFWLDSRGISCPSAHGSGKVMRYSGPIVHLPEHRKATEDFRVLCKKDNSIMSTKMMSTTQLLKTTQLITHSTTRSTPASLNTFIPQIYTVSPTTQQGVPTTTRHQSSSRTRKQTISTTRQQSALTTPQQLASTTYPPVASVTRQQSTLTTRPQAASTTTQQAASTTQQAALTTTQQAALTTTQQAALTTTQQVALTTTQQAASTTTQQAASTTTQQAASTTTQQAALTTTQRAASTTTQQAASTTTQQATSTTTQQAASTTTQHAALTTTQQATSTTTQQAASTTTQQATSTTTQQAASTTTQQAASTTTQQATSTTTQQAASTTTQQATSTTTQQAASTTTQQAASTTTQQAASTTTQQAASTTTQQAASTTTQQATSTTTQQEASTSTQHAALTTTQQATSTTTQQATSTTTQQATSTTTQQQPISTTRRLVTNPAARSSVPGQMTAKKLAISTTSEPEWLKVGVKEYFINYESDAYRRNQNISTNFFKILPDSNADSFWIGAHTVQDEELSDVGLTYVPYKNEPVRFSLTKEQVQAMWKELRQRRDANKNPKPPSRG